MPSINPEVDSPEFVRTREKISRISRSRTQQQPKELCYWDASTLDRYIFVVQITSWLDKRAKNRRHERNLQVSRIYVNFI